MTQHTKGPWKIGAMPSYHGNGMPFRCVYRDDRETHDSRIYVNGGPSQEQTAKAIYDSDADARLIAAAPELLAALNACARDLRSSGHSQYDSVKQADAAIDKAEGHAPDGITQRGPQ